MMTFVLVVFAMFLIFGVVALAVAAKVLKKLYRHGRGMHYGRHYGSKAHLLEGLLGTALHFGGKHRRHHYRKHRRHHGGGDWDGGWDGDDD